MRVKQLLCMHVMFNPCNPVALTTWAQSSAKGFSADSRENGS
jgi:hypothetical protein